MDIITQITLLILLAVANEVNPLTLTVTQNPSGILGNNPIDLVCTYTLQTNNGFTDVVTSIVWQKKQDATYYQNNDNIAILWPPTMNINASFGNTVPGHDLKDRAEVTNPTSNSLSAVLRINEIRCGDEAEYRCIISYVGSSGQISASEVTNLTVRARPATPDTISIMNPSSNIVENMIAEFTCTGNVGKPPGRLVWQKYKIDVLLGEYPAATSSLTLMDGTCTYNATSKLNLQMTKKDDQAVIRCRVDQELAGNSFFRQTEQIRVYYEVRSPSIKRIPTDSQIIAGRAVTLTCTSEGYPPPTYTWYNKDNNVIGTGTQYIIQNSQKSDSGVYTCTAANTYPFDGQTFNRSVSVLISIVSTSLAAAATKTPRSCSEIARSNGYCECDGVYTIYPDGVTPKSAYCDMTTDGGGWTVIQRRLDESTSFFQNWNEYKLGFGYPSGNHWLGNDAIHNITDSADYELRIDMKDWDCNKRYAKYSTFKIGNETEKYELTGAGFIGDGGDSLLRVHNGSKFSTKDQDNDSSSGSSCAQSYTGAWWYASCHLSNSNLNGHYYDTPPFAYAKGLIWFHWKGYNYSLKETKMMIRMK